MEQKHDVGGSSILPMLMLHMNCIFWVVYGYMQGVHGIIPINSIGAVITLMYIIMYYSASESSKRRFIEIALPVEHLLAFGWTGFAYYALPHINIDSQIPMGIACNIPNILFYAAPLFSIVTVVKTKSTSTLSLPLTCASFACALFWAMFGVGEKDMFVWLPNVLGVIFSFMQLCLFGYYNIYFKNSLEHLGSLLHYGKQIDEDGEMKEGEMKDSDKHAEA